MQVQQSSRSNNETHGLEPSAPAVRGVHVQRLAIALSTAFFAGGCADDPDGSQDVWESNGGGAGIGEMTTKGEASAGKADEVDDAGVSEGGSTGAQGLDPDRETETVAELGDEQWQAYTDIAIQATPEQVWEVLTDFGAMPTWSSSLQRIEGKLSDGASVVVTFTIFGMTFELDHTLIYVQGERYGWADPVAGYDGVTDHHLYIVGETDGNRTLFIQQDTYTGTSDAATARQLAEATAPVYTAFNRELRAEVEARFGN